MKNKDVKGIVMEVGKSKAVIMTDSGQFVKVKTKGIKLNIGKEYRGEICNNTSFFFKPVIAACILVMIFMSVLARNYYTVIAYVSVNINPSVKLGINRWNKIIKIQPLNKDGEKIIKLLSINNKSLQDGLNLIVEEAKKENFINDKYIQDGKIIDITIDNNGENQIDLSSFKEYIKENSLKVMISDSNSKNKFNTINDENMKKNIKEQNKNQNVRDIQSNSAAKNIKEQRSQNNKVIKKSNIDIKNKNDNKENKSNNKNNFEDIHNVNKNDTDNTNNKFNINNKVKIDNERETNNKKYEKNNGNKNLKVDENIKTNNKKINQNSENKK
ncbi:anti-sigma factor domain-containing protein [Haloimpatiens sp. FM7330]|uniref:anti-sigma-I factor RsgI family protein n=1 Tax=Haloimpatiens sp. FM7330 TaxID=3298610 RepID=UPI0036447E74